MRSSCFVVTFTISRPRNRQSTLSPLSPFISLPKYFDSQWSYAQYRLPAQTAHLALSAGSTGSKLSDAVEDERCVVAWTKVPLQTPAVPGQNVSYEYQIVALTYSGGWYRLVLPSSMESRVASPQPALPSSSSVSHRSHKGPMNRTRSASGSSVVVRARGEKGKERESSDREVKDGRELILKEFRRYGRWDGWG